MLEGLRLRRRFRRLARLVEAPTDLSLPQWRRLYREAIRVRPDLLIEVGRGYGNSTVVLTEAAHALDARVVSVGDDGGHAWATRTRPRLKEQLPAGWFDPLTIVEGRAESIDLGVDLAGSRRVLLFWDAHGVALADYLLGHLIPVLPAGSRVVVHDVLTGRLQRGEPPMPYRYRGFRSPFEELELLGRYLDEGGVVLDDLDGFVAFTPV